MATTKPEAPETQVAASDETVSAETPTDAVDAPENQTVQPEEAAPADFDASLPPRQVEYKPYIWK